MEVTRMSAGFQGLLPREERAFDPFEAHAATRFAGVTELCAKTGGAITLSLSGLVAAGSYGLSRIFGLGGR